MPTSGCGHRDGAVAGALLVLLAVHVQVASAQSVADTGGLGSDTFGVAGWRDVRDAN